MARIIIGLFAGALWTIIVACIAGEWNLEFWCIIGLNTVIGGLIGAAVSAWNSPPILIGMTFGFVGSFIAAFLFVPREGGWTIIGWTIVGVWGGISGLLTGITIRILKPRQGGWNW